MSQEQVDLDTLRGILDAFNRHALDAVKWWIFADECELYMPGGPESPRTPGFAGMLSPMTILGPVFLLVFC